MDVFSYSNRRLPVFYRNSWGWLALVPVAFVGVFVLTGSFVTVLLGGMAVAVLAFVLHRRSEKPEPPDATHFTPPYGVPAIKVDDPRSLVVPRLRVVPKTHAPTAAKDVEVARKPSQTLNSLDHDPVGRLVHGLRSEGLATLRSKESGSKSPAVVDIKSESRSANVYLRDDRGASSMNQDVAEAVTSVDSLMTYLTSGVHEVGYEQAGWTVASAQSNQTTGRWTAVLQHESGSTVVLNLVDPAKFSAAVRGTNRVQQPSQSHDQGQGIYRQLNVGSR